MKKKKKACNFSFFFFCNFYLSWTFARYNLTDSFEVNVGRFMHAHASVYAFVVWGGVLLFSLLTMPSVDIFI